MESFISEDAIEQSLLQRLVALDWKRIKCDPVMWQQLGARIEAGSRHSLPMR